VPAVRAFPYFGEDIEWSLMLHGEHTIRLSRPIPPEGKLIQTGVITDIFDKGKGAVFHVKITGKTEDGNHLYDAHWAIFYLHAGGFGGDPGPKAEPITPPAGVDPDFSISCKVAQNQAALYRLSGDRNPLHVDPAAAKRGGFDRPILHGLCTYGIATRLLVTGPLEGDVGRLKEFKARFSSTVYPGDTLTTEGWKTDGGYIVQAKTEKNIVLSNAVAVVE
jgi:acyl dehydratase